MRGWPKPAKVVTQVRLALGEESQVDGTLANLSAGTRVGGTLFMGGDECAAIDWLDEQADGSWAGHGRAMLGALLDLHDPDAEVDIEGLAEDDGWLWVIGSHARTRPKIKKDEEAEGIDLARLANLNDTRPRCVIARLPLAKADGGVRPVKADGERRAGMVRQGAKGNKLSRLIRNDALLAPFAEIPAKEGGVDIEGVAVCGDRLAFGMRGPVIRTHALLLEVRWSAKKSGRLHLDKCLVKRLLEMEGLGIRDLKRCGDDLLILAGPTTGLSGPCALYRWRGWAGEPGRSGDTVSLHRPERLFDIPFGRGVDHPEGLALWDDGGAVLVLYDSPAPERVDGATILADVFRL